MNQLDLLLKNSLANLAAGCKDHENSPPIDAGAAVEYVTVRHYLEKAGSPIGPLDTLTAAHALAAGICLVTNNEREFNRVPGLRVENWCKKP